MISPTMAVAAVTPARFDRAEYARDARLARFGALFLDTIVLGFISAIVNGVYGVLHVETFPQITIGAGSYMTSIAVPLLSLLGLVYFTVPEAMFGATPGKQWMRIKVVRLDGEPLRVRDVLIRNFMRLVDYLPVLYVLGGVFVLGTTGAQRIGDIAAGTTVVYRHRARQAGATRSSGPAARLILAALVVAAVLFTVGFDYFGRPPLVIEGDFNQHTLIGHLDSYALGAPNWGPGTVTYPLYGRSGNDVCFGSIDLRWQFLGWIDSGSSLSCVPG